MCDMMQDVSLEIKIIHISIAVFRKDVVKVDLLLNFSYGLMPILWAFVLIRIFEYNT